MNKTKFKYVKFTKPELDRYVRDKNSCISLENSEMHVGFPPWGFATFQETLTNIIAREKVGKYDSKLDGIVLDVRNIKVFGTSYAVQDDDPYNHINIKANFYMFKPRIGIVVRGCVKHISHGHVAVIIYRVFNVSIRFTSDEIRDRLSINQQITFRIKHFDLHGAMPFIEGELLNIRPLKVAPPPVLAKSHLKFDDDGDTKLAVNGISNGESSTNKKITFADSSDTSDDENEDKSELIDQLMFENIKIKEEKLSDSEEETKYKNAKNRRGKTDDSSDSDSSDTDDDDKVSTLRVKQENRSSNSSSSSSSDSESDSSDEERVLRPDQIKREKLSDASNTSDSSDDSSDSSHSHKRTTVKNEKVSDEENTKKPTKRKQNTSIDNELDSFLETTAARSNKKLKTIDNVLDQSIEKMMVSFQSPGLSSTLKPEAKKRKK